jgi:hypothetical protein
MDEGKKAVFDGQEAPGRLNRLIEQREISNFDSSSCFMAIVCVWIY